MAGAGAAAAAEHQCGPVAGAASMKSSDCTTTRSDAVLPFFLPSPGFGIPPDASSSNTVRLSAARSEKTPQTQYERPPPKTLVEDDETSQRRVGCCGVVLQVAEDQPYMSAPVSAPPCASMMYFYSTGKNGTVSIKASQ